jgi:hypothetical protein
MTCRHLPGGAENERSFVGADSYELVVEGRLGPVLASAIQGFDVTRYEGGRTHLIGWLSDQAQLHHALDVLADLSISLVSLNRLPSDQLTSA